MSFSRIVFRPILRGLSKMETSPMKMSAQNFSASTSVSSAAKVPSGVWSLGRLNHVAVATPDLQKSVSLYRDILGAKVRQDFILFHSLLLL
jgi:catechol-2,3-dioxygenase